MEPGQTLEQRIVQLEATVVQMQRVLNQLQPGAAVQQLPATANVAVLPVIPASTPAPAPSGPPPFNPAAPARVPRPALSIARSSEYWLNKIGIGLLLLGVAFLFKYSIDQGWLVPAVRVLIGLALALGLVGLGLRLPPARRPFSQVLLGGGIATWYLTGWAAFQLYALVSFPVAFVAMCAVTLIAFLLSIRQDHAVLALIGAVGGLLTPFLLYTDAGSVPNFVAYTCVLLAGTGAVYLYRGWRSLVATTAVVGWAVLFVAIDALPYDLAPLATDRWVLQAGVVFALLVFWLLPVVCEVVWTRQPKHAPRAYVATSNLVPIHVHLLTTFVPFTALVATSALWQFEDNMAGWIALGGTAVFALAAAFLWRVRIGRGLAATHALVATLLLTTTFVLLLQGDALLLSLAAEAAVLLVLGQRQNIRWVTWGAHALFAVVALWLLFDLGDGPTTRIPFFNSRALTDLVVIGVIGAASQVLRERRVVWTYRLFVHFVLLLWLRRELLGYASGEAYVTVAWGLYATALLVAGLRLDRNNIVRLALGTFLLVIIKLFLVDLAQLETVWRILLFLGLGGLFLVLSYFYQNLSKSRPAQRPADT